MPPKPVKSKTLKGQLKTLAKILVSIALVAWLAQHVDIQNVLNLIGRADKTAFALGALLHLAAVPLAAKRWQWIVEDLRLPQKPFMFYLASYFRGNFIGQLMPGSVGGDISRVYDLKRTGSRLTTATTSVLFCRATGLAAVLLFVVLSMPFYSTHYQGLGLNTWLIMILIPVIAAGVALLVGVRFRGLYKRTLGKMFWKFSRDVHRAFIRPKHRLWQHVLVAVVVQLASVVSFSYMALAVGVHLDLKIAFAVVPLVVLGVTMPISFAGWGVREDLLVFLMSSVGFMSKDQALAASILFGLLYVLAALPGLYFVFFQKIEKA